MLIARKGGESKAPWERHVIVSNKYSGLKSIHRLLEIPHIKPGRIVSPLSQVFACALPGLGFHFLHVQKDMILKFLQKNSICFFHKKASLPSLKKKCGDSIL
jgi:hypothetical protein